MNWIQALLIVSVLALLVYLLRSLRLQRRGVHDLEVAAVQPVEYLPTAPPASTTITAAGSNM